MSIPDGIGSLVIVAFVAQYLRRFLNTKTRLPKWDWVLNMAWPAVGILYGAATLLRVKDLTGWWFWATSGALLIYVVGQVRDFRPARTVQTALIPFFGVPFLSKVVEAVAPRFYGSYEDYFESAISFAFLWLFALMYMATRQKKTEDALQLEREQEAEQRRLIEAKKNELEYLVAERTAEITRQKEELEQTVLELKTTQHQLIQSEKMASLGELTAGIAHEIQNPLNFVNNFSEVSIELLDELTEEQARPERDPGLEADILNDLRLNLEKITHHGNRASSIVKGMLQHSRANNGQREPTDLNALADEYLRLAYHGLRAKDKTFNATLKTQFAPSLGLVSVVPQELGRVLLNLFTNAFYAMQQRQKQGEPGYQPILTVSTTRADGQAKIIVSDNGMGLPAAIQEKIFQPFFTTKPTGEGTGLGLSLSYDIIYKGHQGTITVDSEEGKGATFTILLPA